MFLGKCQLYSFQFKGAEGDSPFRGTQCNTGMYGMSYLNCRLEFSLISINTQECKCLFPRGGGGLYLNIVMGVEFISFPPRG